MEKHIDVGTNRLHFGGVNLLLQHARNLRRVQQTCLSYELVEETFAFDEFSWSVELFHNTLIQDNDAVAVKNCVDTMRD